MKREVGRVEAVTSARLTKVASVRLPLTPLIRSQPWARASDSSVRHLLDLSPSPFLGSGPVAIVGGGITAAHAALSLAGAAAGERRTVHVVSRHELRERQFDTHQDYMVDGFAARRSESKGGEGVPRRQRIFKETKR